MKTKIINGLFGQQGIGLLLQNRDSQCQRMRVILAFNDEIVTQCVGDGLRLAEMSTAIGTGIYFDQTNDIRINTGDKADYSLQVDGRSFEETGKRQWEMVAELMAGTVSDIV